MGKDLEKDFDDEVYEDEYYEEHFEEEELIGEDEIVDTVERDIEEDEEIEEEDVLVDDDEEWEDKKNTRKVEVSYACEDCDYRWEDVIIKKKNRLEDDEEIDVICPMCGSTNITQI